MPLPETCELDAGIVRDVDEPFTTTATVSPSGSLTVTTTVTFVGASEGASTHGDLVVNVIVGGLLVFGAVVVGLDGEVVVVDATVVVGAGATVVVLESVGVPWSCGSAQSMAFTNSVSWPVLPLESPAMPRTLYSPTASGTNESVNVVAFS